MMVKEGNCFGFYGQEIICDSCPVMKRCKAVLMTDGFGILDGVISELLESLPEGKRMVDTDRVSEMLTQLIEGGEEIPDQEVKKILKGMMDFTSLDLTNL